MFDSLLNATERLFERFTWNRFAFLLLVAVVVVVVGVGFERYTAHFELSRIERVTSALGRLHELRVAQEENSSLPPVLLDDIERELADIVGRHFVPGGFGSWVWKAVGGAVPWMILSLGLVPGLRRGDKSAPGGMVLVVVFALIAGTANACLPNIGALWVNIWILPWLYFAGLASVVMLVGRQGRVSSGRED